MIKKKMLKGTNDIMLIESVFEDYIPLDEDCKCTVRLAKTLKDNMEFSLFLEHNAPRSRTEESYYIHENFNAALNNELFNLHWRSLSPKSGYKNFKASIYSGMFKELTGIENLYLELFFKNFRKAVLNEELMHFNFFYSTGNGPLMPYTLYVESGMNEEFKEVLNTNIVKH